MSISLKKKSEAYQCTHLRIIIIISKHVWWQRGPDIYPKHRRGAIIADVGKINGVVVGLDRSLAYTLVLFDPVLLTEIAGQEFSQALRALVCGRGNAFSLCVRLQSEVLIKGI
jgi:hypothetical protein